jgi:hypothetical protein
MRGTVLQIWTPPLLLFSVLAIAAATPVARYRQGRIDVPRLLEPASSVDYCAAPGSMPAGRRLEVGQRVSPRQTAAMLVMLMAQRGRLVGFGR